MEMIESILSSGVLHKKMDTLKRKFESLEGKKADIEEELKHEKKSFMKKPRKEVEIWVINVESVKDKVRKLEQEVTESGLFARLGLERSVDNLTTEVTKLVEQSNFPRGLTIEASEMGIAFLTKRLVGKTFQQNMNAIWDCLINGEDSVIGVYGMGGVGKTTLIMHIHNQLLDHPDFEVAWVTVSQNFSILVLQQAIAKRINLDISKEDDVKKRAAKLAAALKPEKRFVLILDDVWENINLDEVGIRVGVDGHKLILTTRSLTVCRMMSCQTQIKVNPLSPQDAWMLFVETLGNGNSLSHQIEEVAVSIVEECAGLPLGIIIAAGSMRGVDDINEWRNALEEIKGAENWNDDMEFYEVFRVLKYSYDKLKDSKVQECLLYCSLFPEDASIERDWLIAYFIVENLIDGRRSRQSMFRKGHAILNKLESVCLLEGQMHSHEKRYVKMHDLVRDMAIKIAHAKHPFLVKAGMRLRNIPDEEEWSKDLVRVSLIKNCISDIPSDVSPRCPRVLTLLLHDNYHLKAIPECFLMHMNSLSVLDLSYTSIESLPASVSNLESLKALLLGKCKTLSYVPSLANLRALRKLDLSDTGVKEVPQGMEKLVNLRDLCLDRSLIKEMHSGILPKLLLIEHFSASTTWLQGEEMGSLRNLETFRGGFRCIDDLNTCIRSWKRREHNKVYKLEVTHPGKFLFVMLDLTFCDERAYAKDIQTESRPAEEQLVFPTVIETLLLDGWDCVQRSYDISSLNETNHVSRIRDTNRRHGMRQLDFSSCCSIAFVQSLECLKLVGGSKRAELVARERSPSLSSSVLTACSFSSLKQFEISECHNLKRLFMPALFSNLQNLERLDVRNCKQLVEIIGETKSDQDEDEKEATTSVIQSLPKLKSLRLYALQQLKSFCSSSMRVPDTLEEIAILYCWELKKMTLLCEESYPHPSLQRVYVENDCWDLMEWKHPQTKAFFQPYLCFSRPIFFY